MIATTCALLLDCDGLVDQILKLLKEAVLDLLVLEEIVLVCETKQLGLDCL